MLKYQAFLLNVVLLSTCLVSTGFSSSEQEVLKLEKTEEKYQVLADEALQKLKELFPSKTHLFNKSSLNLDDSSNTVINDENYISIYDIGNFFKDVFLLLWKLVNYIIKILSLGKFENDSESLEYSNDNLHGNDASSSKEVNMIRENSINILKECAIHHIDNAEYAIAQMSFFGNFSYPINYTESLNRYKEFADRTGNSTAQYMVGFMYSTGIFGQVKQDMGRSLLYHSLAAANGNVFSEMTLAYRYYNGIGVQENCPLALAHYKNVARSSIKNWRNGPPFGKTIEKHLWKLADEDGGVYGEGVNGELPGFAQNQRKISSKNQMAGLIEYYEHLAGKDDIKSQYQLGRVYYDGSKLLEKNYELAAYYFHKAASHYWDKEASSRLSSIGKPDKPTPAELLTIAGNTAGNLGMMYLRGEGVEANNEKAFKWFQRGSDLGDATSKSGLAYLYWNGLVVQKDKAQAIQLFEISAPEVPYSQMMMGKYFLARGDIASAVEYFEKAARSRYIEGFYYMGEMHISGLNAEFSCKIATMYYKAVAERAELVPFPLNDAFYHYENNDKKTALLGFLMAAEQGFLPCQANVGFILDSDKHYLNLNHIFNSIKSLSNKYLHPFILRLFKQLPISSLFAMEIDFPKFWSEQTALIFWNRASMQSDLDSTIKIGDYYLKGIGCEADPEKAAACYQAAADYGNSALALWNLGWMHENGLGISRDFHLAKRCYDLAFELNSLAYLPVKLALYKLKIRSLWHKYRGDHSISYNLEDDDDTEEKKVPFKWSISNIWKKILENESKNSVFTDFFGNQIDNENENDYASMDQLQEEFDDLTDDIIQLVFFCSLFLVLTFLVWLRQQRQRRLEQRRRGQPQPNNIPVNNNAGNQEQPHHPNNSNNNNNNDHNNNNDNNNGNNLANNENNNDNINNDNNNNNENNNQNNDLQGFPMNDPNVGLFLAHL